MPRKNEMLDVLEKRQEDLLKQIREAKEEIELYEEDDTTYEEEELELLKVELKDIDKQIEAITGCVHVGEPMDPHRFGVD